MQRIEEEGTTECPTYFSLPFPSGFGYNCTMIQGLPFFVRNDRNSYRINLMRTMVLTSQSLT